MQLVLRIYFDETEKKRKKEKKTLICSNLMKHSVYFKFNLKCGILLFQPNSCQNLFSIIKKMVYCWLATNAHNLSSKIISQNIFDTCIPPLITDDEIIFTSKGKSVKFASLIVTNTTMNYYYVTIENYINKDIFQFRVL